MVIAACFGSYLHVQYALGAVWFAFVSIGLIFLLAATPNTPANKSSRVAVVCAFGLTQGLAIGPLVDAVLDIDPSIVLHASIATVLIFVCFSAAALLAERRSYLYLGGILSSGLSFLLLASFVSIFWNSNALFNLNLYGGLVLFLGFVVFDTQLTIEKASMGDKDVEMHALNLFTDLIAIFVRILIILSKNKKKDENNSKRR